MYACSNSVQDRIKQKIARFKSTAAAQRDDLQRKEADAAAARKKAEEEAAAKQAAAEAAEAAAQAAEMAAREAAAKQRLQVTKHGAAADAACAQNFTLLFCTSRSSYTGLVTPWRAFANHYVFRAHQEPFSRFDTK
jgi:hypothetical protein